MNRRVTYVQNRTVLADSGEYTVNLGLRDIITSIGIEFRATNGATSNINNTLPENITSVELIDGSKVLYSLSGKQMTALTMYHRGYIPYNLFSEVPGNTQNALGEMSFGRWHGDQIYALDPSRFANLQLRVKWNLATKTAVGATGYVTGTLTFTAWAEVMEGAQAPQGYLSERLHYAFTTVASGHVYIDLPLDQRLRAIMVGSESDSGAGLYGISNLKFSADQDKFVAFDLRKTDFQRYITLKNGPFHIKQQFMASNGDTIYPVVKQDEAVMVNPSSGDTTITVANNGDGSEVIGLTTGGSAASTDQMIDGLIDGWEPYHYAYWDFGEYDDPNSWFDPTPYRSVRLDLTNDVASSTASVVLCHENVY